MTKTDELLPCPFCGGNAHINEETPQNSNRSDYYTRIACDDCSAYISDGEPAWVLIKQWNTRTAEAPLLAEIERLKSELLQRDAIWLPEKDAEIERLKAKLEQIERLPRYIFNNYDDSYIKESDIDKILESK